MVILDYINDGVRGADMMKDDLFETMKKAYVQPSFFLELKEEGFIKPTLTVDELTAKVADISLKPEIYYTTGQETIDGKLFNLIEMAAKKGAMIEEALSELEEIEMVFKGGLRNHSEFFYKNGINSK